jgi:methylglutamate dehydrogenase subunit D
MVEIEQLPDGTLASLAVSRAGLPALIEAVRARFGVELPQTPRRAEAFTWAGPRRWMVSGLADLRDLPAAVTDQSDSRAIFIVRGKKARVVLAKLLPIDLHPRAFAPLDVALTLASHVNVTVCQLDDAPSYELSVFRSYASYFHHALNEAAQEFL